jgi:hypothetical protein
MFTTVDLKCLDALTIDAFSWNILRHDHILHSWPTYQFNIFICNQHLIRAMCLFGWLLRRLCSSSKMNALDADASASSDYGSAPTTATPLLGHASNSHAVVKEWRDASEFSGGESADGPVVAAPGTLPSLNVNTGENVADTGRSSNAEANSPLMEVPPGEEPARQASTNGIPQVISLEDVPPPVNEVCPPYCSNPGHKHLPSIPSPLRNCEMAPEHSPVRESPQRAGWMGTAWCGITAWTRALWNPAKGQQNVPSNNPEDSMVSPNSVAKNSDTTTAGQRAPSSYAPRTGFASLASTYDGSPLEGHVKPPTSVLGSSSRSRRALPGSKEYIRESAYRRHKGSRKLAPPLSKYYIICYVLTPNITLSDSTRVVAL